MVALVQKLNALDIQDVYEQISAGLTYYSSKPGTVCLMGDWNAHVPASSHPSVPAHLHHLAPTLGLDELNSAGSVLLEFCSAHGLRVVSQHVHLSPAAGPPVARPTFARNHRLHPPSLRLLRRESGSLRGRAA
jgi:hypothetical protein